jgi:NitT/TauT family transport system ATP-binding protein
MHESLLALYDRTRVTIFFITHDIEEAIFLGDKVHVMTTRPCRLKQTIEVNLPRPRSYELLTSEEFRLLSEEAREAISEEAIKAFQSGEREA